MKTDKCRIALKSGPLMVAAVLCLLLSGCSDNSAAAQPAPPNAVEIKQYRPEGVTGFDYIPIVPQPNSALVFDANLKPATALLSTFATTAQLAAIQLTPGPQGPQGATGPQGPAGDSLWTASGANLYRSTGNVGIGTNAPTKLFQIGGLANTADAVFRMHIGNAQGSASAANRAWDMGVVATAPAPYAFVIRDAGGAPNTTFTSRLVIRYETGNVGLSNDNPAYKLDVAGDINLTGDIRKNGVVWNPSGGAGGATACLLFTFDNIPAGMTDFELKASINFAGGWRGYLYGFVSSDPGKHVYRWQRTPTTPLVFMTQSAGFSLWTDDQNPKATKRLNSDDYNGYTLPSTVALALAPKSRIGSILVLIPAFPGMSDDLQWILHWLGDNDEAGRPVWRRVTPARYSSVPQITPQNL